MTEKKKPSKFVRDVKKFLAELEKYSSIISVTFKTESRLFEPRRVLVAEARVPDLRTLDQIEGIIEACKKHGLSFFYIRAEDCALVLEFEEPVC